MRKFIFLISFSFCCFSVCAQEEINRQQFFLDDRIIEVTLSTDIRNLLKEKKVLQWQPAEITMQFSDTQIIEEVIRIQPRGQFRKANCDIASLMLDFKNTTSPKLSPLKKLKLVGGCKAGYLEEQFLLKEFLVYKIYNLMTNMSFRVRLMHIKYVDSKKSTRSYSQFAFLIEDVKEMALRNNCVEKKAEYFSSENTYRKQMTLIYLFQYMIGNCDWSVPKLHNMKLIVPKNDTMARPYAVPYDFDYCGLVDAPYAVPPEAFGTASVTDRIYMGFPRTEAEIAEAIELFNEKRSVMFYTIKNFMLIHQNTRSNMMTFIDEFYEIISNKNNSYRTFIKNARKK